MKKAWQVELKKYYDGDYVAIVAENRIEAKKYFYYKYLESVDIDRGLWIDIRARQIKGVDVQDLPVGVIDKLEGLKGGVFRCVANVTCPTCGKEDVVVWLCENKVECNECCEN